MKKYISKNAICPFYRSEDLTYINCEGIARSLTTRVIFTSKEETVAHKRKYCETFKYEKCPLAAVLAKKYP